MLKTYRLDCVDYVSEQSEVFKYPPDFDLSQYFGDSWGVFSSDEPMDVLIKLAPEIAYRFNLIAYHPSQQIVRESEDGYMLVSYRTSGIYEFTGWLLQLAEYVEVIEPLELRQLMKRKLEKMVSRYV